ncbi:MAG: tRNA (adenosine(37)-N6)-threonylcarbamoyltransferase complex ATPase subunit type 1 TsaE [Candidatus Latescibacteria bacterium]|nr:tRNA (adenosine(37)-N6)-threonylcarbamoyltransferase complex ATPase subunit type 1 TsaE [bacterium]MBD3425049.1 tRNA (adenosine(37)-N6)-threonylcarbamoyltransferase complex ATPase subunit type 1 TsaE [Candidatus Latescibacterota bacterium]
MKRLNEFRGMPAQWKTVTGSSRETMSLGRVFGAIIPAGTTVSLQGGLGSGKTYFIKGVCSGLGISSEVLSPSFILAEEYRGDLTVFHFDLYRLEELGEVYDIGLFDAADGRNIVLVEWGDRLPEESFDFDLKVEIDIRSDNIRDIRFTAPVNFISSLKEARHEE